ncbi:ribonuclease T2 [Sphingomonas sp. MG17]|uniref:Ribonuclease T2 n=1 Tax=Sphingomonas tagetis TaxID=2949092 RepID=A0A9X2HFQ9_9SPHN|nr:ribonuclease T2 [Sphingomonas tagetis]MCP3728972.1 ribonuclease T2 [Sphingomonas tagetis]
MKRAAALAAALTIAPPASAQALRCAVPRDVPDATGTEQGVRRIVPVSGYTLALSWSPGFCRQSGRRSRFQCGGGNRFGFVLHGLWPDGRGRQWPQYCAPAPRIPRAVVRQTLCAMPSPQLQWHQYARHGSCSGLDPAAYFARARSLYAQLRYPDMEALSRDPGLTAGRFAVAFARANPGVNAASIRIEAGRDGWLDEVRLCLDTAFRPRACPSHLRGIAASARLKIWRRP